MHAAAVYRAVAEISIRRPDPPRLVIDTGRAVSFTGMIRILLIIFVLSSGLACEKTIREASAPAAALPAACVR